MPAVLWSIKHLKCPSVHPYVGLYIVCTDAIRTTVGRVRRRVTWINCSRSYLCNVCRRCHIRDYCLICFIQETIWTDDFVNFLNIFIVVRINKGHRTEGAVTGIVELYISGLWASVCYDDFDDADANVVCREMGYSSGTKGSPGQYGVIYYPRTITAMNCTGRENSLMNCSFNTLSLCPRAWANYATVLCVNTNAVKSRHIFSYFLMVFCWAVLWIHLMLNLGSIAHWSL